MSLPWLRLYTEFASDPKIQILAFEDQRHYVMLLCLKGNGTLDTDTPNDAYRERLIAKSLGLDPLSSAEAKRRLTEAGLIDESWTPVKWDSRQFASDSSAERTRRYREKSKGNVTVTSQKRSSDAIDQTQRRLDKTEKKGSRSSPRRRCPEDFQITDDLRRWASTHAPEVNLDAETEAFKDYEFRTAKTDWSATWRSWMRRATPKKTAAPNARGFTSLN